MRSRSALVCNQTCMLAQQWFSIAARLLVGHFATVGHLKRTANSVDKIFWRPNGGFARTPSNPTCLQVWHWSERVGPDCWAIIYCQDLNALPPGTSLISPVPLVKGGGAIAYPAPRPPPPPVPTPMSILTLPINNQFMPLRLLSKIS